MTRPLFLVAVASAAAVLSGCASKPKPALANDSTVAAPGPQTEAPDGTSQAESAADPVLQDALVAAAGADRVYFAFDSAALDEEDRRTLGRQAAWLLSNPGVRARIEGHADERGTREYNLALGARRAAAARQALIAGGVASGRITTLSYGKERPLDPASNEDAWAQNRNAQTVAIGIGER